MLQDTKPRKRSRELTEMVPGVWVVASLVSGQQSWVDSDL